MYTYRLLETLRVLDGDTLDARLDLGFGLTATLRIRLRGVDTPELTAPDPGPGQAARAFTGQWLAARPAGLVVRTHKATLASAGIGSGGFGRWLGDVMDAQGVSLADALLAAGHGVRA